MKITNMKTIYLCEKEIKEALICWIRLRNPIVYDSLSEHLRENKCSYDWEMKQGQMRFVISIDGEVEEEILHLDTALYSPGIKVTEYEETIELYKTYGGD